MNATLQRQIDLHNIAVGLLYQKGVTAWTGTRSQKGSGADSQRGLAIMG